MRVRVIFRLKNKGSFLPFHHQFILAQFLKGTLIKSGNPEFVNYDRYNFSGLKGQTKVSRNGLHYYSNLVTLVLSADSQEFLDHLLEQIFSFNQIELGNLIITPVATEVERVPDFKGEMKFICISPIITSKAVFGNPESKKFIQPETDEFSDLLYDSTIQRLEDAGGFSSNQISSFSKFQFVPDAAYLKKLRDNGKKFARIYSLYENDVKYEVRGYTLPFTLYASEEVQAFLFNCGLGEYAYKGFGMLDIANANPVDRTEKYKFSRKKESV